MKLQFSHYAEERKPNCVKAHHWWDWIGWDLWTMNILMVVQSYQEKLFGITLPSECVSSHFLFHNVNTCHVTSSLDSCPLSFIWCKMISASLRPGQTNKEAGGREPHTESWSVRCCLFSIPMVIKICIFIILISPFTILLLYGIYSIMIQQGSSPNRRVWPST